MILTDVIIIDASHILVSPDQTDSSKEESKWL